MKNATQSLEVAAGLEDEYLRLLARQAQRVPVPVFLASLTIAGLAYQRVQSLAIAAWLGLVMAILVVRWFLLRRLPSYAGISVRHRLHVAIGLSAANGIVQGLSLGFFPLLPEFERAVQSMTFIAMCAASISTTAGYRPVHLAFILPTLVPLAFLWGISPGIVEIGWIERATGGLIGLFAMLLVAFGNDSFRLFRESYEIRLQQAELNRQLQAALEQAETASRAKTRFLASASHDLRQPTHALSLFGAALTLRPLDDDSREIAEHMNTTLQALATQLDALLDISKLDAGVVRANAKQTRLRDTLQRVLLESLPRAREKDLDMLLECQCDAWIKTDPSLFERIVRNLLDNAIKYSDRGCIKLQVSREHNDYVVAIVDTGSGIPAADQARIFEEFYQLDNPERDRTRGLGLGLAIVRRLTELLQIRINLTSEPGRGTTFFLTLPAVQPETTAYEEMDERPPKLNALRVLVVDDEAGNRLAMKTLLEAIGCRAALADSTEQAVTAVQTEKPDVVLSDLRLRGDDNGIETVRRIRRIYPDIPAILISGDIAPDRIRWAEEAGIPLLHKPVPVDTLKDAIARASQR